MPGDIDETEDTRSATARAAEWATRIMTLSMVMVLPGLAGYWLDGVLHSKVAFMLIGFSLGSFIAFKQLLAIARQGKQAGFPRSKSDSSFTKQNLEPDSEKLQKGGR